MSELLPALLRLNLAAGAAVLLALFLRRPARRLFGPRVAYGVWSVVPLAAAATLLPPRIITLVRPAAAMTWGVAATPAPVPAPIAAPSSGPGVLVVLLALWLVGALFAAAGLAWRQVQFSRAVRAGRAGPAVVGVLKPRIVTPDDFARAYTPREQAAVLAHEATHIARQERFLDAVDRDRAARRLARAYRATASPN